MNCLIKSMKIDEFEIRDEYITCEKNEKLFEILKRAKEDKNQKKMTYIIVTENKKPIGIIGFRDIVMKLMGEKTAFGNIYAEKIMTSPIITVKKDRDAKEIYNLMIGMGFRSLPVVDNKENLVGCITIGDLAGKFKE